MAQFTTLYSGSSGNCGLVQSGGQYLLIDIGKSCRITETALKELGLSVMDCQGILITHEHADHVAGLKVFLRHHSLPVYGGAATLDHLEEKGILPPAIEAIALEGRTEDVGGFQVSAFPTSHDVPCCGYRIRSPEGSVMTIATDLGVLTPIVRQNLEGADLVALEANYDPFSLRNGPYPYYLKTRIESQRGHLSNPDCAYTVMELVRKGCKKIALCHLSQENNTPQMALSAVHSALLGAGVQPGPDLVIQAQHRGSVSPWIEF